MLSLHLGPFSASLACKRQNFPFLTLEMRSTLKTQPNPCLPYGGFGSMTLDWLTPLRDPAPESLLLQMAVVLSPCSLHSLPRFEPSSCVRCAVLAGGFLNQS